MNIQFNQYISIVYEYHNEQIIFPWTDKSEVQLEGEGVLVDLLLNQMKIFYNNITEFKDSILSELCLLQQTKQSEKNCHSFRSWETSQQLKLRTGYYGYNF